MEAHLLSEVLGLIGVRGFSRSGNFVKISCLFPWRHKSGRDRTPSMTISVGPGISWVKCFGCQYNKPLHLAIRDLASQTPASGLSSVADWVEQHSGEASTPRHREEEVVNDYNPQAKALMKYKFPDEALEFIASKGVTDRRIIEENLLWHPRLQAIVFPFIQRRRGKTTIIGGGVRPLHPRPNSSKYWMLWKMETKHHLYGEWHLPEWQERTLLLVEGYFDVLHCWQEGLPCCGLVGKVFGEEKGKYFPSCGISQSVLMLDPDVYETPEGLKSIQSSLAALRSIGIETRDVRAPSDPKYLSKVELLALMKEEKAHGEETGGIQEHRPGARTRRPRR